MLLGRDENLAAHVAALLLRCQLVLEVDAGSPGAQHALHQLVDVQGAAEAGLAVCHDRNQPVAQHLAVVFVPLDLVGTPEGVVEAFYEGGYRVDRVEALVGVHVAGGVGIAGNLPAGQVESREATLDVLDCLATAHGPERVHVVHVVQLPPQLFRTVAGQRTRRQV